MKKIVTWNCVAVGATDCGSWRSNSCVEWILHLNQMELVLVIYIIFLYVFNQTLWWYISWRMLKYFNSNHGISYFNFQFPMRKLHFFVPQFVIFYAMLALPLVFFFFFLFVSSVNNFSPNWNIPIVQWIWRKKWTKSGDKIVQTLALTTSHIMWSLRYNSRTFYCGTTSKEKRIKIYISNNNRWTRK